TNRRRQIQTDYNKEHNIQPASIIKQVRDLTDRLKAEAVQDAESRPEAKAEGTLTAASIANEFMPLKTLDNLVKELEKAMKAAAKNLEFEKAAALRDQMIEVRKIMALKEQPGQLEKEIAGSDAFFDDPE